MPCSIMNIAQMKKKIRAELLQKRKTLSPTDCQAKSQRIAEALLTSPAFSSASVIHCYLSTTTEVQTDPIIQAALHLGKRVVVPVISKDDLILSEINDLDPIHFQTGPFGIREPINTLQKEVNLKEVDLFILPGVAYDIIGNRLGQGGGYYDRLLAVPCKQTGLIGLAFEFQVIDAIPIEPTDCGVDQIITEERIIICERNRV